MNGSNYVIALALILWIQMSYYEQWLHKIVCVYISIHTDHAFTQWGWRLVHAIYYNKNWQKYLPLIISWLGEKALPLFFFKHAVEVKICGKKKLAYTVYLQALEQYYYVTFDQCSF